MNAIKTLVGLALVLGMAACGAVPTATRNQPLEQSLATPSSPEYSVRNVNVAVPTSLSVSEANAYYPIADIVWRGDSYGDRYQQVANIVRDASVLGASQLRGPRLVNLNIEVQRFHSLTERTRYSFGGTHSIHFVLTVSDAETGEVIDGPRNVDASLDAWGGARAIRAEREGYTQKVRITNHVAAVIQRELGLHPS